MRPIYVPSPLELAAIRRQRRSSRVWVAFAVACVAAAVIAWVGWL